MRGLSGGQKVKVVLAAATWRRPHIVILDEPTNYLDRESLAALIAALKTFEGGVLVITHNREFSESICSEVWAMNGGYRELLLVCLVCGCFGRPLTHGLALVQSKPLVTTGLKAKDP